MSKNSPSNRFPVGATVSIEQMAKNPYPIFEQMLTTEPVSWVPAFNMWMVTRRADVIELLRDAELYTMEPEGEQINPMEDTFGPMMLSVDGPAHKKIRDVFVEPYRPRHTRRFYTGLIKRVTAQLLDEISQEQTIDLDKAFSDKLAVIVVVATLGFAVDDLSKFRGWYDDFGAAIGNVTFDLTVRKRGKEAYANFRDLVLSEIDRLKKQPNDSVLSQIIHNEANELSTEELISNVALTFFGGVETTAAMLSNTLWALLKHPQQLAEVKQSDKLLAAAIEEAMRWEAPVQAAMRFPVQDVILHGTPIKQGEKIYCMIGAANRDPAFFEQPDQFDIHRENADKHLSFAYGPHFCIGAPLARLEGQIGLAMLFERFPNLFLIPDSETAPHGHEFRSTPTLIVGGLN